MNEQGLKEQVQPKSRLGRLDDGLLLGIMAVLAGCGLIYEYLLSHYAGRILGALEAAVYTMIGLMIVSMGLGAFAARKIRCAFTGFAILELLVALAGAGAIIFTAAAIGMSQQLPMLLAETLELPPDRLPAGGMFGQLQQLTQYLPYGFGVLLGLMVGMEIPLIARVRQSLSEAHLIHNAGTIYGADYIGAGVGAALWVGCMLTLDVQLSASLTAAFNLLAGLMFITRFHGKIRGANYLLLAHLLASLLLGLLAIKGPDWEQDFNNLLYKDKVIYSQATRFQQLTFTERLRGKGLAPVYSLYINGRLQFSSADEKIYHSFLTQPPLLASARHDRILIVGGGDGLAARDVLRWQPQSVTLLDLDEQLVQLFRDPPEDMPPRLAKALLALNQDALRDPRLNLIFNDAFNGVDELIAKGASFDAIIVDLPDPSHPDLNKLYSDLFYRKLAELLSRDGAISIQSTSPYHARAAFISIGKTLAEAGFQVNQYHHNVPSFGEWGWTLGTLGGADGKHRIDGLSSLPVADGWMTQELLRGAFAFPADFYRDSDAIKANSIGSFTLYQYHLQAWAESEGEALY
ncbi:polyamine aminopropyltransferase [Shewanella sedimentimangrovi]|uniref:Polyamine aminopropyltransferase n=1 Tax=Shewanella sedimentimangrovi TaxID=2814293 RepID=A0ABX7R2D8_9GAMM|nr:polyamine aminopropyltransferase [Shewanella sedimentimangrovi]QSX37982.1 polyamine aminopropyltransferase [Shewanella sedimentimangrovi]